MEKDNQYDVIIIGGSYAGLAAAMALGRALRKVLVIDEGKPCNSQTPYSHNFLTQDGVPPAEIAAIAKYQVEKYDTVSFLKAFAASAEKKTAGFEVITNTSQRFASRKLIFATGIRDIMPGIPGFSESWGKSVLHCPYCHGYEVKHQKTGIFANGDTAIELCSLITNWTSDLTLYTNGPSALSEEQRKLLKKHYIPIVETVIGSLDHENGYINNIVFNGGEKQSVKVLYARLPIVQHSEIPKALSCEFTEEGYIKIDGMQRTTVRGVFACGDNTTRIRTVANAVSMGTTAGLMLNKEWIEEDF